MEVQQILGSHPGSSVVDSGHQLRADVLQLLRAEQIVHDHDPILLKLIHFALGEKISNLWSGLEVISQTDKYS